MPTAVDSMPAVAKVAETFGSPKLLASFAATIQRNAA